MTHQLEFACNSLTSTAVQPIYSRLSDVFGRKIMLVISLVIFSIGSLACALSQSMIQLIVFRKFSHPSTDYEILMLPDSRSDRWIGRWRHLDFGHDRRERRRLPQRERQISRYPRRSCGNSELCRPRFRRCFHRESKL